MRSVKHLERALSRARADGDDELARSLWAQIVGRSFGPHDSSACTTWRRIDRAGREHGVRVLQTPNWRMR